LARHEQRSDALLIGLIDRRAGAEEQPGVLEVAVAARNVQRRGTIVPGLFDLRASSEKQPGALEVAIPARKMNSGVAPSSMALLTAAPAPRTSRAHSSWPFWHAMNSAVEPLPLVAPTLAPLSSSSRTASACPCQAA